MALTPDDITTIVNALNESDWDEAVVEIGDMRIAVSRNGPLTPAATLPAAPGAPMPELTRAPAGTSEAAPPPPPAPTTAPSPPAPAPETSVAATDGVVVTAPSVGVFWRAPDPSADPFVEVGTAVEATDTVCIVEVMKLMSNVAAGTAGVVTAILIENGQSVEYGTPLFTIQPNAS